MKSAKNWFITWKTVNAPELHHSGSLQSCQCVTRSLIDLPIELKPCCVRLSIIFISQLLRYRHIGVEYTCNRVGPSAEVTKPTKPSEECGLENRISAVETQLGLGKSPTMSLLLRMKNIEDRLLYLESVSPEYQKLK